MRFQTSIFSVRYESLWDSSLNNTSKLFLWENSSDIHLKIPIHTYIQEAFCILSMLLFVPNKFTCKLHNHGILRPPQVQLRATYYMLQILSRVLKIIMAAGESFSSLNPNKHRKSMIFLNPALPNGNSGIFGGQFCT